MSFVQVAVIAAVIPALVNFVLHRFAQGDGSDEGSVHMPKAFFLAGCVGSIVSLILAVLLFLFPLGKAWGVILFSAIVLSVVCLLAYYSINIHYDCEGFCYRKFFTRKNYRYTDIAGVIPGAGGDYTLVMADGKIRVDGMAVNGHQFLYFAEDGHREAGLGYIPDIPNKLLGGNVKAPLPKLILLCFPGVCMMILVVLFAIGWQSVEIPENLSNETVALTFLEEQDKVLTFSAGGKTFEIRSGALLDAAGLEMAVSQQRELEITYCQIDENRMELWGIRDHSIVYADPESVYEAEVSYGHQSLFLLLAVTLCYWSFVAFFVYIMCNAEKHPFLAALLVKKEDLNI